MTDHTDLIERLHLIAMGSLKPDNGSSIPLADELRRAASALTSQSLSLSEAREEIERLKGLVVGIRECPQEPPGVLCYVAHGRAWFTTASLAEQWGDDWNDEPYEHNAGSPYPGPGVTLTAVAFDAGDLVTPEHEQINSRWSVESINAGGAPWLRSSPYGSGTISVMAGATFREFQQALLASGGTALMPWPVNEEDALRAEISRLEDLAPLSARETARYLECERRLSALENSKARLADAPSKSPDPDLSSLRKGAEAVEAVARVIDPEGFRLLAAGKNLTTGQAVTYRDAFAKAHLALNALSALVSGSREEQADD